MDLQCTIMDCGHYRGLVFVLTYRGFEEEKSEVALRLTEADLLKTALEVISMQNPLCMPQKKTSNQPNAGLEENLVGSSESTNLAGGCHISDPLNRDDNKSTIAATPESSSVLEIQPHTSDDTIAQITGVGGDTKYRTESQDPLHISTKQPGNRLSDNCEGSILDELFC